MFVKPKNDDNAEIAALARKHAAAALKNDTEFAEALAKLETEKPQDDPLCLPGGPESFQTASCDKPEEDLKEEKSDTACQYLYNAIKESKSGILVGFRIRCHHPYMDRVPEMQEAVHSYESLTRVLIRICELSNFPEAREECKVRLAVCKRVADELKEDWSGLLFHDPTARLDR